MPPPVASRLSTRRCAGVLLASLAIVVALWALLPPTQRATGGYLAAMAIALVASRRFGPGAGVTAGSAILLGAILLWPRFGGVAFDGVAADLHLVLLGLAIVGLASYMVTPIVTDTSEQRRRALFELATAGILVWDDEGRFLEVNPAACEMLQYTEEEFVRMSVCDIVGAQERSRVEAVRDRLLAGGMGSTDWRLHRRDGQLIDVEISAKRTPDGRWNAIVRDVSDRTRAEAALRAHALELRDVNARLEESQQRLRLAQELAQFGTFEWEVREDVYRWSPELEALYGVAPGGFGQAWAPLAERIHPDDLPIALDAVQESMQKGLLDAEWRLVRPDGAVRWLASRGWMFRDETGRPVRLVGASFDVTAQKHTEEALQRSERELRHTADRLAEANRLKDEFLATLSHELRTPLQSMIGWSQMLINGSLPAGSVEKAVQAIHRNALVQAQLIGDLLDVSRIISGKLRISAEPVDLVSIVEMALDTVRPAALNKNVALDFSCTAPVVSLVGDPDRLRQVIWNLLSNAVKFTPEGGRVEVSITGTRSHVAVQVADTGIGIDSDFLPFVFERFSQADGSTTKPHKGLGLGLAIAHHLVHLHGGRISVESAGGGKGARFCVTLPCRQVAHRQPPPAALLQRTEVRADTVGRRSAPEALKGVRVLLVDDDAEARDTLRVALETAGAMVEDADSAPAAMRVLDQAWPHVILSDIAMPGVDGYELMRRIATLKRDRNQPLPSIALTAFARDSDRARALSSGFDAHLSKPVAVDSLIEAVQGVLGGSAWRQADGPVWGAGA